MPEIAANDEEIVADFLENTFKVPPVLAKRYSKIAVYLSSSEQFNKGLARVDAWLNGIYDDADKHNLFHLPPGDLRYHADLKRYNVTSRLLNAAANTLGWSTGGNLVMSGFTHPPDFVRIVQKKLMWKDMVASGHGEFTHIIQWLVIYTFMYDEAPELYRQSCDYSYKGDVYNRGRQAYLWDFIVDCFPTPPDTDWRAEARSGTARSPTIANAIIFSSKFLGKLLRDRYQRKEYVIPSNSVPTYTGTTKHSHEKHLKTDLPSPVAFEGDDPRRTRSIFEGQKGYRALITTGYPKQGTQEKQLRTGYLFARSDQVLKQGSNLMSIAQAHRQRLL